MAYRILHIADVHLDMAFGGVGVDVGKQKREQLREAFERALRLARERRCDALCIAGDLYEDGRAGHDRAEYVRRVLGELAPMRVFISPGNHDPCTPASLYQRIAPMPENVHVFEHRTFAKAALADGLTLWGFAHERAVDREPAIAGFQCEGPGTHLLLFHGSDVERVPPGKDAIAPFRSADVERAGARFAMVGHYHGLSQGSHHAYPGSLEPHTFAQDGRHTAALVTVEDGRVSTEFIDINRVRYVDVAFDVAPYGDRAAVADAVRQQLESAADPQATLYFRVRLVGEAQATLDLDPAALESALGERFPGTFVVDECAAFDYDAILRQGHTVRSAFVREMRRRIDTAPDVERPLLERALRYGMLAFAEKMIPH
jgi:exonuclease SbcD